MIPHEYPGARSPERNYTVDSDGVQIAVHEWGDADAPPLMLAHGGFDFGRTFDIFAPLFADAGWRPITWDHRGHGDSADAHLYSWESDLRDASAVFDHVAGRRAVAVIGHSKGGGLTLNLADAEPFRFSKLVNIDGMPSKRPVPDVAEHDRTKMLAGEITSWLDHRARTGGASRKPGTIDELAERRGHMNPRLDPDWLRYLVTKGAYESDDGWRWKLDPSMRFGGFGPWRPEWALMRMTSLGVPFYGLLGTEQEPMGWGTAIDEVRSYLPDGGHIEAVEGVGHFIHIEQPAEAAGRIMEFLGGARMSITHLTHNRVELALHTVRVLAGPNLLLLHGLGEASPVEVPAFATDWPGAVHALDFTGHGASTLPVGGGYTAEILLADADLALQHLGRATIVGRGLGAYIALLVSGPRAQQVGGAVLADGPGISGGPTVPTSQPVVTAESVETTPDPHAILELGRDLRPADYATTFVRLANEHSALDEPISVTARFRPGWLQAVCEMPGVAEHANVAAALASYRPG